MTKVLSILLSAGIGTLVWIYGGCDGMIVSPLPVKTLAVDSSPDCSPDGKWIVYQHKPADPSDTTYPRGLYITGVDSNYRRSLLPGSAMSPRWSPDGTRICFSLGDIWSVSVDGDSLRKLTSVGSTYFPGWSPDGSEIVFDSPYHDERGASAIWIVNLEGGELNDISQHGTGEWRAPDWSPHGDQIVHYRPGGVGGPEIFIMDTSGASGVRLTNNSRWDTSPRWSPDGSTIAWVSDEEIWLMSPDGTNQRRLVGSYAADPAWFPDSKTIVFSKPNADGSKQVLWTIGIDGDHLRQLTF